MAHKPYMVWCDPTAGGSRVALYAILRGILDGLRGGLPLDSVSLEKS